MTNAKGTRSVVRNVLTLKEQLALSGYVERHYVAGGLSNVEFAKEVNTKMGSAFRFPLGTNHVVSVLQALEIPGNMAKKKSDDVGECLGLTVRVQALEEQLQKLTTFIKSTAIFHK